MKPSAPLAQIAFGGSLAILGGLALVPPQGWRVEGPGALWQFVGGASCLLAGAVMVGMALPRWREAREDAKYRDLADVQLAFHKAKTSSRSNTDEPFVWPEIMDHALPKLPLGEDIFLKTPLHSSSSARKDIWGADADRLTPIEHAVPRAKRVMRAAKQLRW